MNMRSEWKTAIQDFLNAPAAETPVKPKRAKAQRFSLTALLNFINMCIYATFVAAKGSIPVLKRKLTKAIQKNTDESFNLRLEAIEKKSRASIPKIQMSQITTLKKSLPTLKSALQQSLAASADDLFEYKKKSYVIKSILLSHMLVIYFAADQHEIKDVVTEVCLNLLLKEEEFKPYRDENEFKNYLKQIISNLLEQNDIHAEAYLKYKNTSIINYLGFYYKDRQFLADIHMVECCRLANAYHIQDYRLDRFKAKAFYAQLERYKQSDQSAKIDSWVNITFMMSVLFLLSLALWMYGYPILGPIFTIVSGLAFSAYLIESIWEAGDAIVAFATNVKSKLGDLLDIKFVENKRKEIFEFKLESRIPQVLPPERITYPESYAWQKLRKKRITPAPSAEKDSIIPVEKKSPAIEEQRSFADANGNIYYHLANNSFFRFNATELDRRKESINSQKLSLATVMKKLLEASAAVGSTDSKAEGIKYVSATEKYLDSKKYPLKFKFKGNPYGSLRIALTGRASRPEETELLKGKTIIHSPGISYRH